ncbi:seminal metalloprotease 1 [Drosophila grimshawi]|uniref:Metalloendopeptidase n=1 Tax=Drosophila grimshawi TaxID=7222 RepID=B4JQV4_DROGR|nr:seminal metalloprotease 1 [Drosophila grimshawi]EDV99284.1 GH13110 [Drosophila grimshawi]
MRALPIILFVLVSSKSCLAAPAVRVETDPELTAGYTQGDMILENQERNGMINESYRWPNRVVYYFINRDIDQQHRDHILRGIRILEANSCLIFKEASSDLPYYINVTSEAGGCFSYVGHRNRVQQLNLENYDLDKGCFRLGTIVHEFLHALGFYHQQSTWNRDDYVRIVMENIQEGTEHNFDKYDKETVDNYGQEYDYGSVMHYQPTAFSKNGQMTIVPLEEGADEIMGQRLQMSGPDIEKLNVMYKCPRHA